jgi:hypothetical protein
MPVPPNMFPHSSNFGYNVVIGGHKNDKPQDESGTVKVIDPLRHSFQISPQDMPFVTMLRQPTQSGLEETPFPPEPGTVVAVSWTTGDPTSRAVVGQPNELNQSQSVSGNNPVGQWVDWAVKQTTGKRRPVEKTKEQEDRGAIVREKVEQQGEWMHDLTKGLATHAAWYPMAGQVLKQVKQIDTAVQNFGDIPGLGALSQLGNLGMNMSSMFKKMDKKQKKRATENLDPMIVIGLENMFNLMSETESGGTYVPSGVVDEETFIENMSELLNQCTCMADVISVMQRMRNDTELHGLDKLQTIEFTSNTAYGNVTSTMDHNGNVSNNADQAQIIQQAIQALTSLMGSNQAGAKGKTLFGDANEIMSKAFQRIPAGIRQQIVQQTAQLTETYKHNSLHKKTLGEEDAKPLSLFTAGGA